MGNPIGGHKECLPYSSNRKTNNTQNKTQANGSISHHSFIRRWGKRKKNEQCENTTVTQRVQETVKKNMKIVKCVDTPQEKKVTHTKIKPLLSSRIYAHRNNNKHSEMQSIFLMHEMNVHDCRTLHVYPSKISLPFLVCNPKHLTSAPYLSHVGSSRIHKCGERSGPSKYTSSRLFLSDNCVRESPPHFVFLSNHRCGYCKCDALIRKACRFCL